MTNDPIHDSLAALAGLKIPGGCDHCDAYQTISELAPMVTKITVHHDEWCPAQRRREGRA